MKKFTLFLSLLSVLLLSSCLSSKSAKIPLISIDSDGNEIVKYLPKNKANNFGEALNIVSSKTFNTLERQTMITPKWRLDTLALTFGLSATVGVLYSPSASASLELWFQKK